MPDKNGRLKYYEFADQINDPKNIEKKNVLGENVRSKVIPISKGDILNAMKSQKSFIPHNRATINFYKNSRAEQPFDYTMGYIKDKYLTPDNLDNSLDNVFFIPESDGYAHNTFNFGNFLWGATGKTLGFPKTMLKMGAHFNNAVNSHRVGSRSLLDSTDDQFSIDRGVNYANVNWDLLKKFVKNNESAYNYIIP